MRNKVIKILQENARLSNREIATMLSAQESEVSEVINELEDEGVILGYKAIINKEKLEKTQVFAVIELSVTPQAQVGFDEIAHRVMSFEQVESLYLMSGGYDLHVEVKGESLHDIAMFVAKNLASMKGIVSTATHFMLRRYKYLGTEVFREETDNRRLMSF